MYAGLQEEIWTQIIDFVKDPARATRSGPNASMGQHDLASCMRVSTAFNQITGPILYHHVAIDRPQFLARGYDMGRAHPDIESKQELLQRTRHLQLEYLPHDGGITYRGLLGGLEVPPELPETDPWVMLGTRPTPATIRSYQNMTSSSLSDLFLLVITASTTSDPKVDLELETLTLGAIRGEHDVWKETDLHPHDAHITKARSLLPFVISTTNVKHLCTRGEHGPFSLPVWGILDARVPMGVRPLLEIAGKPTRIAVHCRDTSTVAIFPGLTTDVFFEDQADPLMLTEDVVGRMTHTFAHKYCRGMPNMAATLRHHRAGIRYCIEPTRAGRTQLAEQRKTMLAGEARIRDFVRFMGAPERGGMPDIKVDCLFATGTGSCRACGEH